MRVGDLNEQRQQLLPVLLQAELGSLLDRRLGVAAGIGERHHLGARGLGLQQERGEILGVERVPHAAEDLAAARFDDVGRVALQRVAERVIGGDEEPGVLAALDHRLPGHVREGVGVVGPVHARGRAGRAGEVGAARARHQEDAVLVPADLLDGERHRRGGHVDDGVDLLLVVPLARDVGADIGLVLVIGGDHLDRLAQHLAAEILDGHLRRDQRALAGGVGIEAAHVVEHAELDDAVGDLRLGGGGQRQDQQRGGDGGATDARHDFVLRLMMSHGVSTARPMMRPAFSSSSTALA